MKNDIEDMLESLTPCRARAELRDEVLGAVADELVPTRPTPVRRARWDFRVGAAIAVSLILGVVLNVWAIRSDDARQARLFGPEPLPRQICETVETAERVAGPECAEMIRQRLVSAWQSRPRDDPRAVFRYRQQLIQLVLSEKGFIDAEKDPQVPQVDRNRLGQPDRSALDRQRHLRVA
jgi:hypothetical protein